MTEPQRVLILDDDEGNRRLLQIALRTGGFANDCAETGAEALALARQNTYAIMLLDVNLPDMSGLDVSQTIRATNDDVVIILATTEDDDAMFRRALNKGADVFMVKPFDIDQLLKFFQNLDMDSLREADDLLIVGHAITRRYRL